VAVVLKSAVIANKSVLTNGIEGCKMNKRIKELESQCWEERPYGPPWFDSKKFAELIVGECIDKIETHRIPVGNSAAGEMACEWTYEALKEIRDEIKEHFGVEE
jgi:hypothetical protein